MTKFKSEDIIIERLNKNHDLTKFKSYEKELVDFLIEDALGNQKKKISVTYIWFEKDNKDLIGYVSLLNDHINLEGNLKTYFRDKGILYKSLPSLKIGRLAVHDDFLRRGVGTLMVQFVMGRANEIFLNYSGCRFILLDAKRNKDREKDSIHFYKKIGFKILKERKKGTTPMYLDLN